jgi:hypothetical protein
MHRKDKAFVSALSLAAAFLLAGCSAPAPIGDLGRGSLVLPVKIVDSELHEIPIQEPLHGAALLGSIPGTIFGDPQAPFVRVSLDADHSLSIDLNRLDELGKQASPINSYAVEFGWKIDPMETRFSRVSTTFDHISQPDVKRVGFFDLGANDALLLVYFDRPCHLTGTISLPPGRSDFSQYVFDVIIENAGFSWLAIHKSQTPGSAVVRHAGASVRPVYLARH